MTASVAGAATEATDPGLAGLGLRDAARLVASGTISSEELTASCLARIAETEEQIGAWAHLDPDYALMQARSCDAKRAAGDPLGVLHGVPVGVKDLVDVAGLPCERGTILDAGRRPDRDAHAVSQIRAAGAVILGKTVTTELALYQPGKTRNPHDITRTPGGSSSGSAAAVADCMVPGAIGSQTNGSVIRPASFCGIYGYKPSAGMVSRRGVAPLSETFDTLGTLARSLEDAALLGDVIAGYDAGDPWTRPAGPPKLLETALSEPPVRPRFAFVRTPLWDRADEDTREGLAHLCAALGDVDEVGLPDVFERALDLHGTVMGAEVALNFAHYYERGRDRLSEKLRAVIETGQRVLARDYLAAKEQIHTFDRALNDIFDRYDAILTPATRGEAPGSETTGDPAFCTTWTFCGVPAVSVPLLVGSNGLPIGVQVVGRRGQDGRLLRSVRWLAAQLVTRTGRSE
ncbi:amidase [Microbaculum marinum]|uniref:Amidase n=1 Tax=Microbaculum marinum TaxID=1764581 RepID=A0AAW9RLJ9_9HYPH